MEAGARKNASEVVPIAEIMTRDVVCVRADLGIDTLAAMMLERGLSGAPVVDEEGRPIGVVSKTDLIRSYTEGGDAREETRPVIAYRRGVRADLGAGFHVEEPTRVTVGDVMMAVAFTLSESAPIAQAAALMAFENVHRVPVVSLEGKVVGIVSSLDILRWMAEQDGYMRSRRR